MSGRDPEGRPVEFQTVVPPEQEPGTYANFLIVWHTAYEFTLDFAATQPPVAEDPDDPRSLLVIPCRVVSRLRIPATLVFDVIRAINDEMTLYERSFGEISRPREQKGQG